MELQNRIAIVTGGGRGIGRAISLALAERGARVVACGRNEDSLGSVRAEFEKRGGPGEIIPQRLDVACREDVDAVVGATAERFERIDILINNAGVTRDGLLMNMEDDQFEEVLTVNLRSVFWMTRAVIRHMVRARKGRIINISSVVGLSGNAGQANYCAAKAGVIALSKTVAKEVARRGVTCNVIAPGFIETDMTSVLPDEVKESNKSLIPARRFGSPEDVASVAAFLAGDGSAYVNGQVIVVDGGMYT